MYHYPTQNRIPDSSRSDGESAESKARPLLLCAGGASESLLKRRSQCSVGVSVISISRSRRVLLRECFDYNCPCVIPVKAVGERVVAVLHTRLWFASGSGRLRQRLSKERGSLCKPPARGCGRRLHLLLARSSTAIHSLTLRPDVPTLPPSSSRQYRL